MISRDSIHKMGYIKIAYLVLWACSILSNWMVYAPQSSVPQAVTQSVVVVQLGHWTEGNTDGHHLDVQADHLEVADVSSRLLSQIHDPRAGHLRCNKSNIILIYISGSCLFSTITTWSLHILGLRADLLWDIVNI